MKGRNTMKKIILSVMLLSMLSLSACKDAPEEVKKENDTLNSAQIIDKDDFYDPSVNGGRGDFEYLTLDEIRAQADKTLADNNTNVIVDKVIISSGKYMPTYKVNPYNKNFDDLAPMAEYLFGEKFTLDEPYCEYHKEGVVEMPGEPANPYDFILFKGESQDYTRSLVYHETGYSFYNAVPGDDPYRFTEYFPTEKRYRLDIGDKLDDTAYTMIDGSNWSVSDAADFALEFADTYFAPLERNEFTYIVTDLRVKRLGESFGYVVELQRKDKNDNIYDNHYYYANVQASMHRDTGELDENCWIAKGCPWLYSSEIQITFNEKEKINSFMKCNTPYAGEQLDDGEKLISLDSAIKIISANMADKSAYSFETAELEYYYVSLDCPGFTDPKEGESRTDNPEIMLNNADVELRPYWAFTMPDCFSDVQGEDDNMVALSGYLYLVDAVTGELHII